MTFICGKFRRTGMTMHEVWRLQNNQASSDSTQCQAVIDCNNQDGKSVLSGVICSDGQLQ